MVSWPPAQRIPVTFIHPSAWKINTSRLAAILRHIGHFTHASASPLCVCYNFYRGRGENRRRRRRAIHASTTNRERCGGGDPGKAGDGPRPAIWRTAHRSAGGYPRVPGWAPACSVERRSAPRGGGPPFSLVQLL